MSQKRSDRKKSEEIIMVEYVSNLIKAINSESMFNGSQDTEI